MPIPPSSSQINPAKRRSSNSLCTSPLPPPPPASNSISSQAQQQLCGGSKPAVERMLEFCLELYSMNQQLRLEHGHSDINNKMLQASHSSCPFNNISHSMGLQKGLYLAKG